ncbi:MAG: carbonic anhydrase, partial [Methanobacterium sp.]
KNSDIHNILKEVEISISGHGSENIFVVGHYDCAGNPVDDITHKEHINTAVNRIMDLFPDLNVIGLWINESFTVEKIIHTKIFQFLCATKLSKP